MPSLADSFRDFAQSASNSVASNVSAPVDGIAWALRKAGVPVPPKPMGGSDWMAEKGLTRTVEPGLAQVLGEAAGMAGPMVAAAKAPQIAAGVNRMAANASAPDIMNAGFRGQRGAIDPAALGLTTNKDGSVSLYHGTTPDGARGIVNTKTLRSNGEPNVYLTTDPAAGYGTGSVVKVDVSPKLLNLDDEFPSGRMDFSMDAPKQFAKILRAAIFKE